MKQIRQEFVIPIQHLLYLRYKWECHIEKLQLHGQRLEDMATIQQYRREISLYKEAVAEVHSILQALFENPGGSTMTMINPFEALSLPILDMGCTHYCLGFAFSTLPDHRLENMADWDVVVTLKHGGWQDGRLNGLGGAVNLAEETPLQAMVREFQEEAELQTNPEDWVFCGSISSAASDLAPEHRYFVHCYGMMLEYETWRNHFYNDQRRSGSREIVKARQTVMSMSFPFLVCDPRCLGNLPLMLLAAGHAVLNNQVNVDEGASRPQTHLVYADIKR